MKQIEYCITGASKWIRTINKLVPSVLMEERLILDHSVGTGDIEVIPIQEGLNITFINIKLHSEINLVRKSDHANNYFILNFYFSKTEISHKILNKNHLEFEHCGVLLSSSMTDSESLLPANLPIRIFNITFSKEWLQKNVLEDFNDNNELHKIFTKNEPIYLFENLDYTFNDTFQSLLSFEKSIGKIWLVADVLKMLTHFFNKIQSRPFSIYKSNANSIDIKGLLVAKTTIEESWHSVPSNELLAQLAGMSLSKFKKLFKDVFGESPYQYYLGLKMNKAKELLIMDEHSVSSVGYILGYSNLSQFTKAFKKFHGILPKEANK